MRSVLRSRILCPPNSESSAGQCFDEKPGNHALPAIRARPRDYRCGAGITTIVGRAGRSRSSERSNHWGSFGSFGAFEFVLGTSGRSECSNRSERSDRPDRLNRSERSCRSDRSDRSNCSNPFGSFEAFGRSAFGAFGVRTRGEDGADGETDARASDVGAPMDESLGGDRCTWAACRSYNELMRRRTVAQARSRHAVSSDRDRQGRRPHARRSVTLSRLRYALSAL
jgi:hypothetical protein